MVDRDGVTKMNGEKLPPLASLYINPTRYCNLRCRHCWLSPPNTEHPVEEDGEISIDDMTAVIDAACEIGLSQVKFTGGEPLLRKDIDKVFEHCSSRGIGISIETNGTLIDKKTAKAISAFAVDPVSISMDSCREDVHDALRGKKGAFAAALNGMSLLRDEGVTPQVILSLYRENLENFETFLRWMEDIGIFSVKVNVITPIGRGEELYRQGSVPLLEEVIDFARLVEEENFVFKGKIYMDIPPAFKSVKEMKCGGGCSSCNIKSILGILSDGSVSLCGIGYVDKELIFGNIKGDPEQLKNIWRNDPTLSRIRKDVPDRLEGICAKCAMKNLCLGSCRAEAYHSTGTLTSAYWFCQKAFEMGLFPKTRIMPDMAGV